MKKISLLLCVIMLFFAFAGCKEKAVSGSDAEYNYSDDAFAAETKPDTNENFITLSLTSNSLSGNLAQNPYEQNVYVYLPPSYYNSNKNYPVVYYLHDFMESSGTFLSYNRDILDDNFASNPKEFILVGVEGKTNLGGSFYVNSIVTGNWENYVVDEVIPLIDTNYRTIPNSASRGICGYSMGGFGAYNLSLKYPDIFGSALLINPYILPDNGVEALMESWSNETDLKRAYGQAFSPDINRESYCGIPSFTGTDEDNAIIAQWQAGIGDISGKTAAYLSLGVPLGNVKIIYGTQDNCAWIADGCEALASVLAENGVNCTVEATDANHDMPENITENEIIPYFDSVLIFE